MHCYSFLVHKDIQNASSDTKIVELSLPEVQSSGIQDI